MLLDQQECAVHGGLVQINGSTGCITLTYEAPGSAELRDLALFQEHWAMGPSTKRGALQLLALADAPGKVKALQLPAAAAGSTVVRMLLKYLPQLQVSHRKSLSQPVRVASQPAPAAPAPSSRWAPSQLPKPSPASRQSSSPEMIEDAAPATPRAAGPPNAAAVPATPRPKLALTSLSSPIRVKPPRTPGSATPRRYRPLDIAAAAASPRPKRIVPAPAPTPTPTTERVARVPWEQQPARQQTALPAAADVALDVYDHAARAMENLARTCMRQARTLVKSCWWGWWWLVGWLVGGGGCYPSASV